MVALSVTPSTPSGVNLQSALVLLNTFIQRMNLIFSMRIPQRRWIFWLDVSGAPPRHQPAGPADVSHSESGSVAPENTQNEGAQRRGAHVEPRASVQGSPPWRRIWNQLLPSLSRPGLSFFLNYICVVGWGTSLPQR